MSSEQLLTISKAQKFGHLEEQESDEEGLGENSVLLESPLDKLEPYQIFRSCLMSKSSFLSSYILSYLTPFVGLQQEQPQLYTSLSSHLSADEQNVIQTVVQQAEANQVIAQQAAQQLAAAVAANGGAS